MEIKPPTNNLYTAIKRNISTTSQTNLPNSSPPPEWKVTQLIQAVITQITGKQLMLDIRGVKANTPKLEFLDLQIGDTLKLQIEQLKPMPQFKIIAIEKASNANLISQTLNSLISQKTSIAPLLKDISFVATRPALHPSPLPTEINAAVRNLFSQLPSPFNLKTGTQVKNHLQNTGIFIENKVKNQLFSSLQNASINKTSNLKSTLEVDLGAQLLRLANMIKTQLSPLKNHSALTPPQDNIKTPPNITDNKTSVQPANRVTNEQVSLQNITQRDEAMQNFLRQIESSLTHMQQTQLQNLNESQAGRPTWLIELPIKDGQDIDLFELHINEEETAQTDGDIKKIWNVILQFDLTGLGKIKAHIKMQNDFISAQFFSEKSETLTLFHQHFDFLRGRLNHNGLDVGNIECAHANLSKEVMPINTKRLDERS